MSTSAFISDNLVTSIFEFIKKSFINFNFSSSDNFITLNREIFHSEYNQIICHSIVCFVNSLFFAISSIQIQLLYISKVCVYVSIFSSFAIVFNFSIFFVFSSFSLFKYLLAFIKRFDCKSSFSSSKIPLLKIANLHLSVSHIFGYCQSDLYRYQASIKTSKTDITTSLLNSSSIAKSEFKSRFHSVIFFSLLQTRTPASIFAQNLLSIFFINSKIIKNTFVGTISLNTASLSFFLSIQ